MDEGLRCGLLQQGPKDLCLEPKDASAVADVANDE